MCKFKLFWPGALFHPRIIANRLCDLFLLLAFIVFYACLENWYAVVTIAVVSILMLLLITVSPDHNIEIFGPDGRKMNIMVFNTEIRRPAFLAEDKRTGKAVIRIISTDKDGKYTVNVKYKYVNDYSKHLALKGFFLACEEGYYWTAYGINYPEGFDLAYSYPSISDVYPTMFAYNQDDELVLNLFSEYNIFSITASQVINSSSSLFMINPEHAMFTLYNSPSKVEDFLTNDSIIYLLIEQEYGYQLLAYVNFLDAYKLYSVKTPKFTICHEKKYFDFIYDKNTGYKIFNA